MDKKEPVDAKMTKVADTALLYALGVSILGAVLKLNHMKFANQSLMVGLSSLAVAFLIKNLLKNTLEGYIAGITLFLACIAVLFELMHFPGADILTYFAIASAVVYVLNMARNFMNPPDQKKQDE